MILYIVIYVLLLIIKILLVIKNQIMHNDLDLFIIGIGCLILISKNRMFFLLLCSRTIRICIIFTISMLLSLLVGKFWLFRLNSRLIFSQFKLTHNLDTLYKKPAIILCNYPALMIEHLVHGMLPEKTCLVVWEGVKTFTSRMVGEENLLYTSKNCFEKLYKDIKIKIKKGYYIVAYPEKKWTERKNWYDVCQLRTGMFRIAQKLNIPVIPMAIDHMRMTIHMDTYHYRVKLGKPLLVDDIDTSVSIVYNFLSKSVRNFKYKEY